MSSGGNINPAASASKNNEEKKDDWRKSVTQSFRSAEIREISKVLAALEPGATTASKMMLAMRFEDSIFQSSESLADYRKRLTKRLKKLQKSYTPSKSAGEKVKENERLERELRNRFGERLKYILGNSAVAIEALREKHGKEKADNLKLHTDNIHQCAVDIGVIPEQGSFRKKRPKDDGFLEKLKLHLDQRVENIRRHVVNLTEPDRFLEETLARVEEDLLGEAASAELSIALVRYTTERLEQSPPTADVASMKKLLEKLNVVIPPPRQGHTEDNIDTCLAYLEKISVASQIMITFLMLDANQKAEFRGVLKKAQSVAAEGVTYLCKNFKEDPSNKIDPNEIKLENTWTKPLKFAPSDTAANDLPEKSFDSQSQKPPPKRRRIFSIVRTKVLLKPGRKIQANLLSALEAKEAKLVRPNGNGGGARLIMTFGSAFEMIIFFTPLLVTIRALQQQPESTTDKNMPVDIERKTDFRQIIMNGCLPTYIPSRSNLYNCDATTIGNIPTSKLSPIIAKKLDYASAQATTVLRQCFSENAEKNNFYRNISEFEIEISEATALLKFLQIARSNYLNDSE